MKNFEDFRDKWLTGEKLSEIQQFAISQTENVDPDNIESRMATFSANYALQLLAEYHNWIQN